MTEVERNAIQGRALLLYDGVCALCNGVVQFLLKHDGLDRFRYAPLQSSLGREVLARFDIHTFPDGVMLLTDALSPTEHLYQRSTIPAPYRRQSNAADCSACMNNGGVICL